MQTIFFNQPNGTKRSMALLAWLSMTQNLEALPLNNIGFCEFYALFERFRQRNARDWTQEKTNPIWIIWFVSWTMRDLGWNRRIDDSIQNVKAVTNALFYGPFSAFNSSKCINQSMWKLVLLVGLFSQTQNGFNAILHGLIVHGWMTFSQPC